MGYAQVMRAATLTGLLVSGFAAAVGNTPEPGAFNHFLTHLLPQQAVIVAQGELPPPVKGKLYGTTGVCFARSNEGKIDPDEDARGGYGLTVRNYAYNIFLSSSHGGYTPPSVMKLDYEHASVTVLQQPQHGTIRHGNYVGNDLSYYPTPGYAGNDKATFLVDIEGYQVKVVYYLKVVLGNDSAKLDAAQKQCPDPNPWRISLQDELKSRNIISGTDHDFMPEGPLSEQEDAAVAPRMVRS